MAATIPPIIVVRQPCLTDHRNIQENHLWADVSPDREMSVGRPRTTCSDCIEVIRPKSHTSGRPNGPCASGRRLSKGLPFLSMTVHFRLSVPASHYSPFKTRWYMSRFSLEQNAAACYSSSRSELARLARNAGRRQPKRSEARRMATHRKVANHGVHHCVQCAYENRICAPAPVSAAVA